MMIDRDQRAWITTNDPCGLVQFDIKAGQWLTQAIPLADCNIPVGVSIDSEGFVWVVDQEAQRAYKVHPETFDSVTVDGLIKPYTYSDMTGSGLRLQVDPPG